PVAGGFRPDPQVRVRAPGRLVRSECGHLPAAHALRQEAASRLAPAVARRAARGPGQLPAGIAAADAANAEGGLRRLLQPGPRLRSHATFGIAALVPTNATGTTALPDFCAMNPAPGSGFASVPDGVRVPSGKMISAWPSRSRSSERFNAARSAECRTTGNALYHLKMGAAQVRKYSDFARVHASRRGVKPGTIGGSSVPA